MAVKIFWEGVLSDKFIAVMWCIKKKFTVMIKIRKNHVNFMRNTLTAWILRDIMSKRAKGTFNFFVRNYMNSNRKAP